MLIKNLRVRRLACILVVFAPTSALAGAINTDAALTPSTGGSVFRLKYTYSESDGHDGVQHVNASVWRSTYAFGLRRDLALIVSVPYVHREMDMLKPKMGRFERSDSGFADATLLLKYRFYQDDPGPGETYRWAVIGGLNVRSGDSDFTSDSYDPILGTTVTWRSQRQGLFADLIYQFNTGGGQARHDVLRYDVAYTYRLAPVRFEPGKAWEINAIAEMNGRYTTDGSHEVFLSPGVQFVSNRWVCETGLQIPVIQDLAGPKTDYKFIVGFRYRW